MKEFKYTITDEVGIHARPAGQLVKAVKTYESVITLGCNGKSVSAKALMMVMGLGVKKGMEVTVTADGADEDTAIVELEKFFQENL